MDYGRNGEGKGYSHSLAVAVNLFIGKLNEGIQISVNIGSSENLHIFELIV